MNVLPIEYKIRIVKALVRGNGIRGSADMLGHSKNTVLKLQVNLGQACIRFSDAVMHDLPCRRLQCDELWSYVRVKQFNIPKHRLTDTTIGDVYVWIAMCPDTKLVPHWYLGKRNNYGANFFMSGLSKKLGPQRVQITTDAFRPYFAAVAKKFLGRKVDYAMVNKDEIKTGSKAREKTVEIKKVAWIGDPNPDFISTSVQ